MPLTMAWLWPSSDHLTHLPLDKMAAVSQTTFSSAFSWMKNLLFWFKFHWILFLMVQLTITQHWFRKWLGTGQATNHYLNHWWLDYRRIYASLGLNELMQYFTAQCPVIILLWVTTRLSTNSYSINKMTKSYQPWDVTHKLCFNTENSKWWLTVTSLDRILDPFHNGILWMQYTGQNWIQEWVWVYFFAVFTIQTSKFRISS